MSSRPSSSGAPAEFDQQLLDLGRGFCRALHLVAAFGAQPVESFDG